MIFFRNGLTCTQHPNHGATCAIDSLLETYYYGVHKVDPKLYNGHNKLLNTLSSTCMVRSQNSHVTCDMREEAWNWCVENLPGSFRPKGTDKAELLSAFMAMGQNSGKKFVSVCQRKLNCSQCHKSTTKNSDTAGQVITYLQTVNEKVNGDIGRGVKEVLDSIVGTDVTGEMCETCHVSMTVADRQLEMSDFLIVHIALDNAKNVQIPPAILSETISVYQSKYRLTAAVQMRPGHFYSIVKTDCGYMVLDDLQPSSQEYSTLHAAVTRRQQTEQSSSVKLDQSHDGIHILIYAKQSLFAVHHSAIKDCHNRLSDDRNVQSQDKQWIKVENKKTKRHLHQQCETESTGDNTTGSPLSYNP